MMFYTNYFRVLFIFVGAFFSLHPSMIGPTLKNFSEQQRTELLLDEIKELQKNEGALARLLRIKEILPLVRTGVTTQAVGTFFESLEQIWKQRQPSRDFDVGFYEVVSLFTLLPGAQPYKEKIKIWIAVLHKDMASYALHSGDCVVIAKASRPALSLLITENNEKYHVHLAVPKTGEEKLSGLFTLTAPHKKAGDVVAAGDDVVLQPLFAVTKNNVISPCRRTMAFTLQGDAVAIALYSKEEKTEWKIERGGYSPLQTLPYLMPGQAVVLKRQSFHLGFDFLKKLSFSLRRSAHPSPEDCFVMRVCSQKVKNDLENNLISEKLAGLQGQSDAKVVGEISHIMRFVNEHTLLAHKTALVKKIVAMMEKCRAGKTHVCRSLRYLGFQILASPFFSFYTSMVQTGLKRMNGLLRNDMINNKGHITLRKGNKYLAVIPGVQKIPAVCWVSADDSRLRDRIHFFKVECQGSRKILSFGNELHLISYYGGADHTIFRSILTLNPPALGKPLPQKIGVVSGDVVMLATREVENLSALSFDASGKLFPIILSLDSYNAPRETHFVIEKA